MHTVRVQSPVSDDNPLGFVTINAADFNPDVHQLLEGETLPIGQATGHLIAVSSGPSVQELAAEAARIEQARAELTEKASAEFLRLQEQATANTAEADRLAALRAELDAEKAAFESAAKTETPAAKPGKKT